MKNKISKKKKPKKKQTFLLKAFHRQKKYIRSKIIYSNILQLIIKIFYICLLFIIYLLEDSQFLKDYFYDPTNNIKVCLCIMGKDENKYAKEYVNHYKKLGYNHIFLYDNNDIDGERFENVIKEEINLGFVSIINWRGQRGYGHSIWGPQLDIYRDCYEKNNKNYDWLSFYDFDEFLEIYPKNLTIQQFLGNKRYEHCQNIKINFLMFGDNELLYYDNRTIEERFTKPLYKHGDNAMLKSMVRGNLSKNYWKHAKDSHTSTMKITCCNSLGEVMSYKDNFYRKFNFTYAALKHYYSKTVEEYVQKTKRGEACYKYTPYDNGRKYHKIRNFFYYNKKTDEKIKLFKSLFNIP